MKSSLKFTQTLNECLESPQALANFFPTFISTLGKSLNENALSVESYERSFLSIVSEATKSNIATPMRKFHCLYLLLKMTELKGKEKFMINFATNDDLLRIIFHTAQTEILRSIHFDDRGKDFFGKSGTKDERLIGINYVRLCYEMILQWGKDYGVSNSKSDLHIYYFLAESLKKKTRVPLSFNFQEKNLDLTYNLGYWDYKGRAPPVIAPQSPELTVHAPEQNISIGRFASSDDKDSEYELESIEEDLVRDVNIVIDPMERLSLNQQLRQTFGKPMSFLENLRKTTGSSSHFEIKQENQLQFNKRDSVNVLNLDKVENKPIRIPDEDDQSLFSSKGVDASRKGDKLDNSEKISERDIEVQAAEISVKKIKENIVIEVSDKSQEKSEQKEDKEQNWMNNRKESEIQESPQEKEEIRKSHHEVKITEEDPQIENIWKNKSRHLEIMLSTENTPKKFLGEMPASTKGSKSLPNDLLEIEKSIMRSSNFPRFSSSSLTYLNKNNQSFSTPLNRKNLSLMTPQYRFKEGISIFSNKDNQGINALYLNKTASLRSRVETLFNEESARLPTEGDEDQNNKGENKKKHLRVFTNSTLEIGKRERKSQGIEEVGKRINHRTEGSMHMEKKSKYDPFTKFPLQNECLY